jgi:hypothetical protein
MSAWLKQKVEAGVSGYDTVRFRAIFESRKYGGLALARQILPSESLREVLAPGFLADFKRALEN